MAKTSVGSRATCNEHMLAKRKYNFQDLNLKNLVARKKLTFQEFNSSRMPGHFKNLARGQAGRGRRGLRGRHRPSARPLSLRAHSAPRVAPPSVPTSTGTP